MNDAAANKILKFLEEPPKNTFIILCAPSTNDILPTILSRCQIVNVPRISDDDILTSLQNHESAKEIAYQAQGDWNLAKSLSENNEGASEFETLFIQWVRNAFQAKKKPEVLREIVKWARQISDWNREKQMKFLIIASRFSVWPCFRITEMIILFIRNSLKEISIGIHFPNSFMERISFLLLKKLQMRLITFPEMPILRLSLRIWE
jgi:hypothetical protein